MIECTCCKTWYQVGLCAKVDPKHMSPKTQWYCGKCKKYLLHFVKFTCCIISMYMLLSITIVNMYGVLK